MKEPVPAAGFANLYTVSPAGVLVGVLFTSLSLLLILLKSPEFIGGQAALGVGLRSDWAATCLETTRPCLRAAAPVLAYLVEGGVALLAKPFFWGLERSAFDAFTPWVLPDTGRFVVTTAIPFVSHFLFRFLCLVPILWLVMSLWKNNGARCLGLLAIFGGIFGWHPSVVSGFFNFMQIFIDWPASYYVYHAFFRDYDWLAIGFLASTLLYAACRRQPKAWEIVAFSIFGQFTIEHLGFIFGVTIAATAFLRTYKTIGGRVREAVYRLLWSGLSCVATAAVSTGIFWVMGQRATPDSPEAAAWFANNIAWLNVVVANLFTLTVLALAGGIVAGVLSRMVADNDNMSDEGKHALLVAAFSMILAFLVVAGVSVAFLAYPAEMGRQFAPLAMVCAVAGLAISSIGLGRRVGATSSDAG